MIKILPNIICQSLTVSALLRCSLKNWEQITLPTSQIEALVQACLKYVLMNWPNHWNNQIDGVVETERGTREKESCTHAGSCSFFPAASAPPRQTDFIWRIKQMHLEIALSLSLSLCLPPSLSLSFIFSLSPSLSPDCSDQLITLYNTSAGLMHELYISCMWRLLFRVTSTFLARCARRNNLRCYWLDFCSSQGVGGGLVREKEGKQIQNNNNTDNNVQQNPNRFIYQINSLWRQLGLGLCAAGIQPNLGSKNEKFIYVEGGESGVAKAENTQLGLDEHFMCVKHMFVMLAFYKSLNYFSLNLP